MTVNGSDIVFDFLALEPALPRPDELRLGNDTVRRLCRDEAHLPRGPDQRWLFPHHCTFRVPSGTFLYADIRALSPGCAAEVAQRIMEAVFGAMGQAIPERMFASPAGTSGKSRSRRLGSGARRRLHHVLLLGRRLRRLVADDG